MLSMKTIVAGALAMACGASPRPTTPIENTAPAPAPVAAQSVEIWTTVVDSANDQPIAGALVVVLRPGVDGEHLDRKELDKQALARGRSDTKGVVHLAPRVAVPGTYSVVVVAAGYETLVGKDELRLAKDLTSPFDPWGKISLHVE